jgi:hypothetical protein
MPILVPETVFATFFHLVHQLVCDLQGRLAEDWGRNVSDHPQAKADGPIILPGSVCQYFLQAGAGMFDLIRVILGQQNGEFIATDAPDSVGRADRTV